MNLQNVTRHIRIAVRAELLAAQAKLSFAMRRTSIMVLALLFIALGVVLVNMALFAWLTPAWGPVWTPLGLGLLNFGLAVIALLITSVMKPGPEIQLAEDLRNMAGEAIEAELRSAPLLGSFAGGFERAAMSSLLLPALSTIIGAMRKRKSGGTGG